MGCFPALSTAASLDAGINQGRAKQRDLSLLQVQMSVQTNVELLQPFPLFIYWVPRSKVELGISNTQPFLYPCSKPEDVF